MAMLPKGGVRQPLATTLSNGALVVYENDGTPILGIVLGWKKQRYQIWNDRGRELELDSVRLHELPGRAPEKCASGEARTEFLTSLKNEAEKASTDVAIEEIWSSILEEGKDVTTEEISNLYFGDNTLSHHLAVRWALFKDKFYFKRKKDEFSPRAKETVEELRLAEANRLEKLRVQERVIGFFKGRLSNPTLEIPTEAYDTIRFLEDIVVKSNTLDQGAQKEGKELVERCGALLGIDYNGRIDQKAYLILEKIHHFHSTTNLSLVRYRPPLQFRPEVIAEAETIKVPTTIAEYSTLDSKVRRDLTTLQAFTIDDASTQDMDDGLSCEVIPGGYRFGVHISDVASLIPLGSVLDEEAKRRGTSVYLPERNINMFPESLAHDRLSLVVGEARPCISYLIEVDREWNILNSTITPSLVRITKKFSYDEVDQILEQGFGAEGDPALMPLYEFALNHETARYEAGGMKINKHEVMVVLDKEGNPSLVEIDEQSPGRALVAEMAVLTNAAFAEFAVSHGFPLVFRGQEPADDNDSQKLRAIPQGAALDYAMRARLKRSVADTVPHFHATLGLNAYAQVTSPIRRYVDLVNQRQILNFFREGAALYSAKELFAILEAVEDSIVVAQSIQKETKRFWLLDYLQNVAQKRGTIEGTVIRIDTKNPIVELDEVYMTAPVKMDKPPQLGERITVRIGAVDPVWDYLKLEAITK